MAGDPMQRSSMVSEVPMTQGYESINLSSEHQVTEVPAPVVSPSAVQPIAPNASPMVDAQMPMPTSQSQINMGNVQFPMQPQVRMERSLPRDALLAKARAYRESQIQRDTLQPEQLAMNMDEAMPPRLTPEPARSPFESDNLEVPSYLRRKRGLGIETDGAE